MTCKLCNSGNTNSFSSLDSPHIYCRKCGGHEYEGQLFDRNTWAAWVNGDIERPAKEEQLDLFGEAAA